MQRKELFSEQQILYPLYLMLQLLLKAKDLWARISSPEALPLDAPLEQREAVRRGQLTSKVLLILFCAAFFNMPATLSLLQLMTTTIYVGMLAFLFLATFLNRRGKSTLAGFIVMINVEFTLVWFVLNFPGGFSLIALPMLDFLVIPTLLAVSLLPPLSVFPVALVNIFIIVASILFLPKEADLQALLSGYPGAVFCIPVLLQLIISGISFLWVRGSMEALRETNRADRLDHLYHEQSRAAETDAITGLPNHRAIMNCLQETLERCEQGQETCALLFMDLDHFKQINDMWGHLAGDMVLREAGKRLQETLGAYGKVGRYGGEEFAVVLKDLSLPRVYQLAEEVRVALASVPCLWQSEDGSNQKEIMISASIGIAMGELHGRGPAALIEAADQAMYQAKLQGRNCVRIASEPGNTYAMQWNRFLPEMNRFLQPPLSA